MVHETLSDFDSVMQLHRVGVLGFQMVHFVLQASANRRCLDMFADYWERPINERHMIKPRWFSEFQREG